MVPSCSIRFPSRMADHPVIEPLDKKTDLPGFFEADEYYLVSFISLGP